MTGKPSSDRVSRWIAIALIIVMIFIGLKVLGVFD